MRAIEDIVKMMNNLLHADLPDDRQIGQVFEEIRREFKPVIRFLDFEYYNEKTLRWAKQGKADAVKAKNYEVGAEYRDIEVKCQEYVAAMDTFGTRESAFHYKDDVVLYLYFGNARNDKAFKKRFLRIFNRLVKDKYC